MHALLIALAACCLGQQKDYTYRGARMAATIHTWTNGTEDASWATVGNWSSGALPGSGGVGLDKVVFDGAVTQTGPSADMDRSADSLLHRIIVRPNFTGSIGGPGNYLIHGVNTMLDDTCYIIHRGSGAFYYTTTAGEGSDLIMDGAGSLYLDCGAAAIIRNIFIKAGTVSAANTCSIQQYVVLDGPSASLTVAAKDAAENDPDWIIIRAGTYTNNRAITADGRAILFGGLLDQRGLVADGAAIMAGPAAQVRYTPSGTLGAGHNPDILVLGEFDGRGSNQDIAPARLVIGQLGMILGSAVQSSSAYIDIDLREEYP